VGLNDLTPRTSGNYGETKPNSSVSIGVHAW